MYTVHMNFHMVDKKLQLSYGLETKAPGAWAKPRLPLAACLHTGILWIPQPKKEQSNERQRE